jgi:4-amino-4-deoxy-L-arabinose transferase
VRCAAFALSLLFAAIYLAPLGSRPFTIPDETRYAEIPREMLADGDWVVPRLCGVRYFEKPPMGYWLTAVSISFFGDNRFAARLPSALATGTSALLLVLLVARTTGTMAPALWAAFIFLTIPFVFALGVVNVLDAPFATCVTASIVFAFLATREPVRFRRFAWLAAAGVSAGLAFLVKGFLAFALPVIVIGSFLLLERRWRELLALPWIPLAAAVVVIFPWACAVHAREPDYWRYFVVVEHLQRFLKPGAAQHPEPFWFLIPYLVAGPLLWALLAPALVRKLPGLWGQHRPLILLSVTWLISMFLFFSASSGKLGTYILPCFAPAAILFGLGAWRVACAPADRLYRIGCALSALLAVTALAVLAATPLLPANARVFQPAESMKLLTALAAVAIWFILSAFATFTSNTKRGLICVGIAIVPVLASLHFVLPARALFGKAPERVLADAAPLITPETEIFAGSYLAPAVCWQLKTTRKVFVSVAGELAYGLSFTEHANRGVTEEQIAARLNDPNRRSAAAVVLFVEDQEKFLQGIPKPDATRAANGVAFFLFNPPQSNSAPLK